MWRDVQLQDFADRQALPSADAPVDVYDFRPGSRAVLVTLPVQDGIVGLVPFPGEWQVWEFFHEHVAAHQSFASFLAHHAREVRRSVAKRAERVRTAVGEGNSMSADIEAMAEQGDERAVELACRALVDPRQLPFADRIAVTLGLIGDARALPALRRTLDGVDGLDISSLGAWTRPEDGENARRRYEHNLLIALDSCGDSEVVDELKRRAARSPDGFAAQYLARRDERLHR
jgi:hypothetical protein